MIKNKASVNEESVGNIEALKLEILRLKNELAEAKNNISQFSLREGHYQINN